MNTLGAVMAAEGRAMRGERDKMHSALEIRLRATTVLWGECVLRKMQDPRNRRTNHGGYRVVVNTRACDAMTWIGYDERNAELERIRRAHFDAEFAYAEVVDDRNDCWLDTPEAVIEAAKVCNNVYLWARRPTMLRGLFAKYNPFS
jgi:hypothetical protein